VNWPSFEYACQQGWDYSNRGTDSESIAAIAAWRINVVRIPLNQDCWLGDDRLPAGGLNSSTYRDRVAAFVDRLNQAGIVAILDLHWSGPDGVVADGLRPMADQRSPAFWSSVATRFRDHRSVIFDLFNEPHSRWSNDRSRWIFSLSWDCWANGGCQAPIDADTIAEPSGPTYPVVGMNQLIEAVRLAGAAQPLLISGRDYANDLSGVAALLTEDDQLIAGFHVYPEQACRSSSCWQEVLPAVEAELPVIASEVGQRDCRFDHVSRFLDWADQRRIGYLAWAWWELPDLGCSNFALISKLDGTPTPGYGEFYRAHLLSVAEPALAPARQSAQLKLIRVSFNRQRERVLIHFGLRAVDSGRINITVRWSGPGCRRPLSRAQVTARSLPARVSLARPSRCRPRELRAVYSGGSALWPEELLRRFAF